MTENFSIKVAAIEYVISAEYDEANRTLKVMKNGELVSERPVKMRLNSFFTSVVLDGENVVFVCLERSFDGFFNKLFKRSPAFKLDLFVDGVSVKDATPITRAKDKATELIEKGFLHNMVSQLKWTAPVSVVIAALPPVITLLFDRFKEGISYPLYIGILLITACVWVLLFTALSWLRLALVEENWDRLFEVK